MHWPFIGHEPTTTSAARRAHAASSRAAPPPEIERAQWRARACHVDAGSFFEATAGTSYHGRAPKERGFRLLQWAFAVRGPTTTNAARRAQQQSRMLRLHLRDTERIGALAHATRKPAHFGRLHLARLTTTSRRRREPSRRWSGCLWCVERPQSARHGVRAQQARALRLLPRETASALARLHVPPESRLILGGRS